MMRVLYLTTYTINVSRLQSAYGGRVSQHGYAFSGVEPLCCQYMQEKVDHLSRLPSILPLDNDGKLEHQPFGWMISSKTWSICKFSTVTEY